MADDGPVTVIEPEVIAIFVQNKKFGGQAPGQGPLPLGHDRLGAADDAGDGIAVARQLAIEPGSPRPAAVIGDPVDGGGGGVKPIGQPRIAGHQIDEDGGAVRIADSGDDALEQIPGTALDQQNARSFRLPSGEEISHATDYYND